MQIYKKTYIYLEKIHYFLIENLKKKYAKGAFVMRKTLHTSN